MKIICARCREEFPRGELFEHISLKHPDEFLVTAS
jgi:hypothetical protein